MPTTNSDERLRARCVQPRLAPPALLLLIASLFLVVFLWSSRRTAPPTRSFSWAGETQGTHFRIRIIDPPPSTDLNEWQPTVNEVLSRMDQIFSRWNSASLVSKFNAAAPGTAALSDESFIRVVAAALQIAEQTDGAFDPTLGPLMRLWGFGPCTSFVGFPSDAAIVQARRRVGWRRLQLQQEEGIWTVKKLDDVELDLDAVAQGYTADVVAAALRMRGATNFMIEIGGEVVVSGHNAARQPWRIGIDLPLPDTLPGERLAGVLHLTDCAIATSGGYRRRRTEKDGQPAIHIFDGRLGRPLTRERSSVTVVARDGLTADGLATAAFILGPVEGIGWLASHWPDVAALFLEVAEDGAVTEVTTPDFAARTGYHRLTDTVVPFKR